MARLALGALIIYLSFKFLVRSVKMTEDAVRWQALIDTREEADNDIEYRSSRKNHPAGKKRIEN